MKYVVIDTPLHNIDGPAKVTGAAQYTFDITLPNMLYGKVLRSPHPHAKILNIETSKAERLIGVKAVVTGKDTLGVKQGIWRRYKELCDEEILAREKVRYIGEPVAAVAAVDEDVAEEALSLIEVEYEPLPAVFDPMEAIKEGRLRSTRGWRGTSTSPVTLNGGMWTKGSSRPTTSVRTGSRSQGRPMFAWRPTVRWRASA